MTTDRRFATLGMMLGIFLAGINGTIVSTAMPTVVASLGGLALYSWVFAIYMLFAAIMMPLFGRLADIYGRKCLFYVGIGAFVSGSVLAGAAQSMPQLIAFRAVQGIGAGAMFSILYTVLGLTSSLDFRRGIPREATQPDGRPEEFAGSFTPRWSNDPSVPTASLTTGVHSWSSHSMYMTLNSPSVSPSRARPGSRGTGRAIDLSPSSPSGCLPVGANHRDTSTPRQFSSSISAAPTTSLCASTPHSWHRSSSPHRVTSLPSPPQYGHVDDVPVSDTSSNSNPATSNVSSRRLVSWPCDQNACVFAFTSVD